ncbi:gamma-glutamyltransferase [bacterium]|jgi:gamma-glutamyltranspeptidase/glutathione hydrolase|nr:gamma-glutamyltransferase [bacterium]
MLRLLFISLLFAQGLLAADGDQVMAVTAHPLATEAAVEVLRDGGNAMDAAITASFVLAVVEPYSSGIGGGGFFICYDADKQVARALDARETAPSKAFRDMYLADGEIVPRMSIDGPFSVAVPGLVRGLTEFHTSCGTLPWKRLIEPAISIAKNGFPVDEMLRARIEYKCERLSSEAKSILMPDGVIPSVLIQEDLSRTLQIIAQDSHDFYSGSIAAAIASSVKNAGGLLSAEDMSNYKAKWRETANGDYHQYEVWSMPPPSSGGVHIVQMLNILEPYDLETLGHNSVGAVHLMAEAMKFAYADRSRWLGDSDYFDVPITKLTSKDYAKKQRSLISLNKIFPINEAGGIESKDNEGNDTTHFSIVDAHGNAVAATLTINLSFGSGMIADGTGIILNNEMDDFSSAPGIPNAFGLVGSEANSIASGKRPLSSMTPTIITENGQVRLVTGSPGGSRIITTTLQTVLNILDHKMAPQVAVDAGRIHYQWSPDILWYEPESLTAETVLELTTVGHNVQTRLSMGNVQLILIDPETGIRTGASDKRGVGKAAGY